MSRNGLHDETKDARWPVHLAGIERLRIAPTVEAALLDWKPAPISKSDFIHDSVLIACLGYLLYNGRWVELYRTLGRLLGLECPAVPSTPAALSVGTFVPERPSRPVPVSDGAMRDLAGVRKTR